MAFRACANCKHGIQTVDGNGNPYVVCAVEPPRPITIRATAPDGLVEERLDWVRPCMSLKGYCGQFRVSWRKYFYGQRA